MQEFHRKWMYHKDFEPILVESEEQFKGLGKGWVEHPTEKPEEPGEPAPVHGKDKIEKKKGKH